MRIIKACMLSSVVLVGCSGNMTKPPDKDPFAMSPKSKPVSNKTMFTHGIECMNDLVLKLPGNTNVSVMIEPLNNESGDNTLATSAKTMLSNALSRMANNSNTLRIVSLNGSAQQILLMKDLAVEKPKYYINGSITQSEKKHTQKGQAFRIEGGQLLSVDIGDEEQVSALALDLQMGELSNLQLVNGVTYNNVISLIDESEDAGAGAGIKHAAIDFSKDFQKNESRSAAIRILIEEGAINLIGKLLKLPYESCINPTEKSKTFEKNIQPAVAATTPLNVKITPTKEEISYKKGDFISLNVSVSESAYLRCYYKDELGETVMIYPNNQKEKSIISGNHTITIPNPELNAFQLQIQNPGSQEFMCMASNTEIENILPNSLKGTLPLKPISGFSNLNQIASDTKNNAKNYSFGFAHKQILIK